MDRRVKYTKMVLNESLIRFLETKDIARITVTEICMDADINRSTYYVYFTDPFDQLAKLKADLLADLTEYAWQIDTENLSSEAHSVRVLKRVLAYVEEKRHIFHILLTRSGDHQLQQDIMSAIGEKAFPLLQHAGRDQAEKDYLMMYAANGCFGMFFHWLTAAEPISSEQLALHMADFTSCLLQHHL